MNWGGVGSNRSKKDGYENDSKAEGLFSCVNLSKKDGHENDSKAYGCTNTHRERESESSVLSGTEKGSYDDSKHLELELHRVKAEAPSRLPV